jgi:hypothetical protein
VANTANACHQGEGIMPKIMVVDDDAAIQMENEALR